MERPALNRLITLVQALRHPDSGCPWDLEQTHQSLLPYLFEESYEFKEAVESQNEASMLDELGDLMLQVILHARIAEDRGSFTLEDVAENLCQKIVRRHPHVFDPSAQKCQTAEDVSRQWQEIKRVEGEPNAPKPAISRKVLYHAALKSAQIIGQRTQELNFDWDNASQVAYKVEEEWQELKEEIIPGSTVNSLRIEEELGDFLFSAAQLSRHLKIDPEAALQKANRKFLKRFSIVEMLLHKDNKKFNDLTQSELDVYWNLAKKSP